MVFIFGTIILIILWVNGIKFMQDDGMLLSYFNRYFAKLPFWLQKPLWNCAPCMCSVHGFLVYIMLCGAVNHCFNFFEYLTCAVCATVFAVKLRQWVIYYPDDSNLS